jgi:hypothetical protein
LNKYRLPSKPLLNPEKENTKKKLQSVLKEAQANRKPASVIEQLKESSDNNNNNNKSSKSKVVKKPVPNFGGGKFGSK